MQTVVYAVTIRYVLNGTVQAVCWADERVRMQKHGKYIEMKNSNVNLHGVHISFQFFFSVSVNNGQGKSIMCIFCVVGIVSIMGVVFVV